MRFTFALVGAVALAGVASASARDYLSIAGSSTFLPFATIVAEQLGTNPSFKTPVVESGGSSVGKGRLRRHWHRIHRHRQRVLADEDRRAGILRWQWC